MTISEKVAYLKGLAEGLNLDTEKSKEGKLISVMIGILEEVGLTLEDLEDSTAAMGEELDAISDDLADVEEIVFDDDDEEEGCCHRGHCHCHDDDDFFEVECPTCGAEIDIDESILEAGTVECPSCGDTFAIDLCDEEEDGGEEGEAKEEAAEEGEESKESDKEQGKTTDPKDRKQVSLNIHQVDNSNFPEVTFYASVVDENNDVVDSLGQTDFTVQEISTSGEVIDVTLNEVYRVLNEDTISVNLVLDASGSMDSWSKMEQAKSAANTLVSQMELSHGDQVEIISFDDYVYLQQDFTRDQALLETAINNITPRGSTALYDALYAGLYQTYYESGVKCVIGFTDGMENCSSYTFDDVVAMAQNTSIPVFIIGIGEEYDVDALKRLAMECSGEYYSANVQDLESILTDIYLSIYEQQQDYYVFKYTSSDESRQNEFRDIVLSTSETTEFDGAYTKEYVPQSDDVYLKT